MGGVLAILMPLLGKALDLIPDPAARAQQLQTIIGALQEWDAQQNKVNEAEAQTGSLFLAGWRPMIGWICALALAYQYMFIPFVNWYLVSFHKTMVPFPTLDGNIWQLMFGMLGMGGLRTFEKIKGVQNQH